MIQNTINHLLKDIRLHIPEEILKETFLRDSNGNYIMTRSLDGILKETIIVDIVLRHCNLYAGKIAKIQLKESWLINTEDEASVLVSGGYPLYKIPLEAREYKDIIYPIDVSYPFGYAFTDPYYGKSYHSIGSMTEELYESTFNAGSITPIPQLKENNLIYLDPPQPHHIDWILTCMLSFDSNFTNAKWNMIKPLSDMAIYATQMYIYNKLRIKIDNAYIHSGHELGVFKEIVESYSDAKEKYEEALMNFRGASTFDEETALGMLNLMIN